VTGIDVQCAKFIVFITLTTVIPPHVKMTSGVASCWRLGQRASGGQKSPSGVQGQSPGGGLEAKPKSWSNMLT